MIKQNIDLGFVPQHFQEGTHMCLIYKDDKEREDVISKYLPGFTFLAILSSVGLKSLYA